MNRKVIGIPFAIGVSLLVFANALYADEPKYRRSLQHSPDPKSVHDTYTDRVDIAAWWLNKWAEQKVRDQLKKAIDAQVASQQEVMKWTGKGALLNLRVI